MSLALVETLQFAKDLQFEIERLDDPVEIAFHAKDALRLIDSVIDEAILERDIITHSVRAYILGYRDRSDSQASRHFELFENVAIEGKQLGFGFMSNIQEPRINSIFLAVKGRTVFDIEKHKDQLNKIRDPNIVMPVLEIFHVGEAA